MTKYIITDINEVLFTAKYEDDVCVELRPFSDESVVGNIYVARVENVVKNINSAFVEIQKGIKCYYSLEDNKTHYFLNKKNNDAVNQGDLLLVQISADAIKSKPATASSKLTLTGKYVVLSTDVSGINISKKTQGNEHCKKLKKLLSKSFSFNVFGNDEGIADNQRYMGEYGFILRTNSAEAETEVVLEEALNLVNRFKEIINFSFYRTAFTKLYTAPTDYVEGIIDSKTSELSEVITDKKDIFNMLINSVPSDVKDRIRLYSDELLPLRNLYSLERELEHALSNKVWLKCGGYLIIEQTEALSVIDVNTGKFVAKKGNAQSKATTLLKVNMEAAKEIARQLRLRNLTGIIIIDFINMQSDEHIEELLSSLNMLVKNDSVKCHVVDITKLGLVEMTRQKKGKSLKEIIDAITR